MIFGEKTQQLLAEVEARPNIVPSSGEGVDFTSMRSEASQVSVELIREGLVATKDQVPLRPGQIAQTLSLWHRELKATCSRRYEGLTSTAEGRLSRIEANQDPELLALQALKRGIKDAKKKQDRLANTP